MQDKRLLSWHAVSKHHKHDETPMRPQWLLLCVPLLMHSGMRGADPPASLALKHSLSDEAQLYPDWDQQLRSRIATAAFEPDEIQANTDVPRDGESVYATIAPSVVLVLTKQGSGTGFFVDSAGWLVTNNHVVEGSQYSVEHGGQICQIQLGRLNDDGLMERDGGLHTAIVYAVSLQKDLALLKLTDAPPEARPAVRIAGRPPRPGQACFVIGHPAAGMLWTFHTGQVSGVGVFPDDDTDYAALLAQSTEAEQASIRARLEAEPERRRVVMSTCGLNPGNSGSPVLNSDGELIGVHYASPMIDFELGVDLDVLSYHIHLDELREFVAEYPQTPVIVAPEPLPLGGVWEFGDQNSDGRPDRIFFSTRPGAPATGALIDLDQDSFAGLPEGVSPHPTQFDYELVVSARPRHRLSYDTDNDGTIDCVLADENDDGDLDTELRLSGAEWTLTALESDPYSGSIFTDGTIADLFDSFVSPPTP
jgi:S1-C subfamily serine protease